MEETWRPVPGFEGLYEVSSLGNLKGLKRNKNLKPRPDKNGYHRVVLTKFGKPHYFITHRLVALAFIPNPEGYPLVLHNDGSVANNTPDNLRWGNNSQNMLDRGKHGTDHHKNKTHCIHGHKFTPENTYLNRDGHRSCQTCRRYYTEVSNEKRRNGFYDR